MDAWLKKLETDLTEMPSLIQTFVVQRIDAVCSLTPDAIKSVVPDFLTQPGLLRLDQQSQENEMHAAKAQYEKDLAAANSTINQLHTSLDNAKSLNAQLAGDLEAAKQVINQLQCNGNELDHLKKQVLQLESDKQHLLRQISGLDGTDVIASADSGTKEWVIADNEELHRQVSFPSQ